MSNLPGADDASEMERDRAELARKVAEFDVLQRVSSEITSTLDLEEIYDIALHTMDELFEFHHANILLLEPGGDSLVVVASRGYENFAVGGRVTVGTGVTGVVAKRRKMLHVSNLGQKRAYAAAQRRQVVRSGHGSELGDEVPVPGLPTAESQIAIPLLIGDDLIGVFSIESPVRRTFSDHEQGLVSIVANQIASAIHNARLYEERARAARALQAANASLEERVAERTAALERELRVAQELLSHARRRVEGPLLGESPAVRGLRDAIARVAGDAEPVLLVGPPGSGREAVAHAVHDASGRSGAFIAMSCPELATDVHHRHDQQVAQAQGAADSARQLLEAKLELASRGTLFLDAVHRLSLEFRIELAALLQDYDTRLAKRPAPRDVRIVASTTRELESDTQDGRPDPLWSLFSGRQVAIPPLTERRQDLPVLIDYFLRRQARHLGKVVERVSDQSMRRLETYPWPGNIRELRTVLERAILVCRSPVLEVAEELLDAGLAVGSYRLVSRLGSGGMGDVWRAKHRFLARPAAVKLIRHHVDHGREHEELVRRFQREAEVTAGLRSPHTVQLYDFGVNETGSFYYVMELLDGLDGQRIVNRFGAQPWERVVMLLRQACRSLAEAHAHGLVHRDIKPPNLFVTRLGVEWDYLKVLDFGMVKDAPGAEATMLSAADVLRGTPAFMAPEQVLGDRAIDGRADLYSLACTAYWMLSGKLVFPSSTPAQMLLHHVQTMPQPPSTVSDGFVPPELDAVIMACLRKDPEQRLASVLELDARLAAVPCDNPWTQERARAWWEARADDLVSI